MVKKVANPNPIVPGFHNISPVKMVGYAKLYILMRGIKFIYCQSFSRVIVIEFNF